MYGIYTDYDAHGNYSLIIGAPVSNAQEIPEGMINCTIPSANYAVFSAQGPFAPTIANTWATVWQTNLDRAFTYDFEVYDAHSTNNDKSIVNIYIAVK
jgi:predicted transcriptional regulator YdeE